VSHSTVDVLVVGAGLAGLTAARRISGAGRSVHVLEARERAGGRVCSVPLAGGVVDLGAQWLGPGQDRAHALARELGVAVFPQHHRGRKVACLGDARTTYRGLLPRIPLRALFELALAMQRVDWRARKVPLDAPWTARDAAAWDTQTAGAWLDELARTREARSILEVATQAIFAADADALSLLYFLFYVRSGRGLTALSSIRGGAQQDRLAGGVQQLADRLAAGLSGHVSLNTPVLAVAQDPDGVTVRTAAATLRARLLVLAVPPALARAIDFTPALPEARAALHAEMPMGSVIKCVVAYERPFWREHGYSGEAIFDTGPIRMLFDDCGPDGSHPALVAFAVGGKAKPFGALPEPERRAEVLRVIDRAFGPSPAPLAYVDRDWSAEPWSAGCYVGLMPPGLMTRAGEALRRPCGRIHFAGTETATRWAGYIDGAIESGERAAAETLNILAAS
jgi:monoamine oxidase